MATIEPIERRSLSDAVFAQLQGQILAGEMQPGTPLPSERRLCEMLGVNRGALREALKRLEQARLIAIHHGGVTRVADYEETGGLALLGALLFPANNQLDTHVARSIMEMRSAIAPDAARLAALRATTEVKGQLEHIVVQMSEAGNDGAARQRLAQEFWGWVVRGSDNIGYRLAYNTLRDVYDSAFEALAQVLASEYGDLGSYRAIVDAIVGGDTAGAEQRARELMRKGAEELGHLLDRLDAIHGDNR